jgi:hypothetical protein
MLSAVYTHKFSDSRNLTSRLRGDAEAETVSSGHTFYLDGVEVAHLYNYLSGPSRIEVGGEHFLMKRQKRVVLFTQKYTLKRDDGTVATAKETILWFRSNSRIRYSVERHLHELTLKANIWKMRGGQYRVFEEQDQIGIIEHDSEFGADIALPPEMPLAVQIFICNISFRMSQRGRY